MALPRRRQRTPRAIGQTVQSLLEAVTLSEAGARERARAHAEARRELPTPAPSSRSRLFHLRLREATRCPWDPSRSARCAGQGPGQSGRPGGRLAQARTILMAKSDGRINDL